MPLQRSWETGEGKRQELAFDAPDAGADVTWRWSTSTRRTTSRPESLPAVRRGRNIGETRAQHQDADAEQSE
jgi:hypothetical protein